MACVRPTHSRGQRMKPTPAFELISIPKQRPLLKLRPANQFYVRSMRIAYGNNTPVVQDFSLNIHRGETVGIIGESGSGKSTAALAIPQLLHHTAQLQQGEIFLGNIPLHSLNNRQMQKIRGKDIGVIFQDPMSSLNPFLRIEQQLIEHLTLHLNIINQKPGNEPCAALKKSGYRTLQPPCSATPSIFKANAGIMIATALACEPALLMLMNPRPLWM